MIYFPFKQLIIIKNYKQKCLCTETADHSQKRVWFSFLLFSSNKIHVEVVDHMIKSTQQGEFPFDPDIVLSIF